MSVNKMLNVGIVGIVRRGGSFKKAFGSIDEARIHAVCDINEEGLDEAMKESGASEKYTDFDEMLEKSDIDIVVIGTPMQLHVEQSIKALEKDIHVLSEVAAGISVQECRRLAEAVKKSRGLYMMAENYIYMKPNMIITGLVKRGLFGEVYYAEGEYIHELKALNEQTPWRRKWHTGVNGITYPTHSLGPILTWMPGDRVKSICCAGSGHHYIDPRGDRYEQEDTTVMLCKTEKGRLIKIRLDMISDRPHSCTNYSLQGTRGCYESARSHGTGDRHKIWLDSLGLEKDTWMYLDDLDPGLLPPQWQDEEKIKALGAHGGGDYLEITDFVDSIIKGTPVPIDIHRALDMTLPGLISQESIAEGGKWMEVPDSRLW
ncbi:MAG: Gfo/Idh/MocA family protein [Spirochaetia bacterium]